MPKDTGTTPVVRAVPKPETSGMMLVGVGLIGAIVRRRRNSSRK